MNKPARHVRRKTAGRRFKAYVDVTLHKDVRFRADYAYPGTGTEKVFPPTILRSG
ncbi:MAG: hypothetical protein LBP22_00845 [Deltaproteobacteria bacterium]|nr:hypothetical protein [Deltaproteobacteria bacterium]